MKGREEGRKEILTNRENTRGKMEEDRKMKFKKRKKDTLFLVSPLNSLSVHHFTYLHLSDKKKNQSDREERKQARKNGKQKESK